MEEERCKRSGQAGHKDARSRLCRMNKNYDPDKVEDDTDEGPLQKKQKVEGSISSAAASTLAPVTASRGTPSTTVTVRAGLSNTISLAQRMANRRTRAAGKSA